ncbi:hypothetical protein SPRI_4259 [Streptomyces pristinaespiralis]|uniref:Uncharacterized protein n=1 Tax=Streptomyces pristinaespiralis TaxID=38300 RepID=A0A0M4DBV5_STRPR|nr:hypothetical protein SPRI_4259 [Streptomyces pristinaespiralis]
MRPENTHRPRSTRPCARSAVPPRRCRIRDRPAPGPASADRTGGQGPSGCPRPGRPSGLRPEPCAHRGRGGRRPAPRGGSSDGGAVSTAPGRRRPAPSGTHPPVGGAAAQGGAVPASWPTAPAPCAGHPARPRPTGPSIRARTARPERLPAPGPPVPERCVARPGIGRPGPAVLGGGRSGEEGGSPSVRRGRDRPERVSGPAGQTARRVIGATSVDRTEHPGPSGCPRPGRPARTDAWPGPPGPDRRVARPGLGGPGSAPATTAPSRSCGRLSPSRGACR